MKLLRAIAALAMIVVPTAAAHSAVIGANFSGGTSAMGPGDAGVVPAPFWNNVPDNGGAGGSSLLNLVNNSNAATTLDVAISQSNVAGGTAPMFSDPDNNAMFGGHSWIQGNPIVVTATQIPYAQYDLYVYFRSGQIPFNHQQLFSIDNNVTNTVLFSQEGLEPPSPGPATQSSFVQSTGSTANGNLTFGNYVKFSNVNLTDLRLNLAVENTYTYINGIQFVQTPEPTTFVMLALGALGLFVFRRRQA